MKSELVKTSTSDELILSGLFIQHDKTKPVIIHVHGYEGDFFSNSFISALGNESEKGEFNFLSIQTRGTGCNSYFDKTDGTSTYNGSHYELLEEAHLDISAWVKFLLDQRFENIILQGHSLGTIKVVRYLFEGEFRDKIKKLILLAPFDKNNLLKISSSKTLPELIDIAKQEVAKGNGNVMAPNGFDDVPHSYANFLSWVTEDNFGHMFDFFDKNYDFPILSKIQIPTKIIVGTEDPFFHPSNSKNPEEAMDILTSKIPDAKGVIIKNSGHGFNGFEDRVVEEVGEFLNNQ